MYQLYISGTGSHEIWYVKQKYNLLKIQSSCFSLVDFFGASF